MSPDAPSLSLKQLLAVQALATGLSINEAADRAGVNEKTVDRWLKLPEFQKAINQTKRNTYDTAIAKLVGTCTDAVETLREVATNKQASSNARVTAARVILETAYRGFIEQDIEQRVKTLEEGIANEH